MASPLPWRRILAESVAIVSSILIAFAIDASWESHRQRHELVELLEGLRVELLENRGILTEAMAGTETAAGRLQGFSTSSADDLVELSPSEFLTEEYLPLVRSWDLSLSTGFLEAVTNSGKLALIPNPETRAALNGFHASLGEVARLLVELDRTGTEAAIALGELEGVRQALAPDARSLDVATRRAIRRDSRLVGLASARVLLSGGYTYWLETTVAPRLERAIELIGADLEAEN